MFPLEQHTIFLALAGSQAHGTAREGSDVEAAIPRIQEHPTAARGLGIKTECLIFDAASACGP